MTSCKHCNSTKVVKRGTYTTSDHTTHQRMHCTSCFKHFSFPLHQQMCVSSVDHLPSTKRYVITSCQNNTPINQQFFSALQSYVEDNDAKLLIIPTIYRSTEKDNQLSWEIPEQFICNDNIEFDQVRVYGALKIAPTAENPLAGLDPLSKGKTIIVGHNQLQMRSLPVSVDATPAILHTTGTISVPNYVVSKQGEKATFNHSFSALVLELDHSRNIFHIRVLNSDVTGGFYDLDRYYYPDGMIMYGCDVDAIVTGDEHALFIDPSVKRAVYTNIDSIVNTLRPKIIVRHDVVDSHSISHHDKHNFLHRYIKHKTGKASLESELLITEQLLEETTPAFATNWIVSSNHHDHITKWLNTADPKDDMLNAKLYHWLMWRMLHQLDGDVNTKMTPFEIWLRRDDSNLSSKTVFIGRLENAKINGIDVSLHGDVSSGGARGSAIAFSKLPQKTITGHSHSPFIHRGAYGVGCLCIKNLSYVNGPGSWMATSCIIHKNGKRQLITVVDGEWRLK